MALYFFIKTYFNKGAAAATGCLSLLGAVYLPFLLPLHSVAGATTLRYRRKRRIPHYVEPVSQWQQQPPY